MDIGLLVSLLIVSIFGLAIGSFLNVVIYRLPRRESIIFPASYCPVCNTPIKYRDNIPVISYILLGGRCRACSVKISLMYPFVECMTVCLAVVLFLLNGPTIHFITDFILGFILLAAAIIDLKHMIIPDRLNFTGALLAIALSILNGYKGILLSIGGGFLGFVMLMVMYWMGKLLFKREGVGFGDVKLAIVIGLFIGPLGCFFAILCAIVIGGIWGSIQLISGSGKIGKQVPFGPFIAAGGLLVIFFRVQILYLFELYLRLI